MKTFIPAKKCFNWCYLLWLSLFTTIYLLLAIHTAKHFTLHLYKIILGANLSVLALFLLLHKINHRLVLKLIYAVLILALIFALLSKNIIALLVFIWLFLLGWAIGKAIIDRFLSQTPLTWLEKNLLSITLGLGCYSFFIFALAIAHLLYFWPILIVLLLGTLILRKTIIHVILECRKAAINIPEHIKSMEHRPVIAILIAIAIVMMLVNFIGAIAPEVQFDSLMYHLAVPKFYIQNHGIMFLPNIVQSNFVKSIEMIYLLGMVISGQIVAKLFSFAISILTFLTIIAVGRRFFSAEGGVFAAVLFYMLPITSWLATTTYNDCWLCFYVSLSLLYLLLWSKVQNRLLLLLSGVIMGLAIAAKLYSILYILPFVFIIIISQFKSKQSFAKLVQNLLLFGLPIVLIATPWCLITYFQTGNPVFPYLNTIFKSPLIKTSSNFGLEIFGMGHSIKSVLLLPWYITFKSGKYVETPNGVVGIVMLIALPSLLLIKTNKYISKIFIIILLVLVPWFFIGQYLRYIMPVFLLLSILAGYAFAYVFSNAKKWFVTIVTSVFIFGLFIGISFYLTNLSWAMLESVPLKLALGLESKEQYLSKIALYPAFVYLNSMPNAKTTKILLVGPPYRYYMDTPYVYDFFLLKHEPKNKTRDIKNFIIDKKITYILMFNYEMEHIDSYEEAQEVEEQIISKGLTTIEFKDNTATLYRVMLSS